MIKSVENEWIRNQWEAYQCFRCAKYHMHALSMAFLGTCECNCTPFPFRPEFVCATYTKKSWKPKKKCQQICFF